jgi:hypothetical protein
MSKTGTAKLKVVVWGGHQFIEVPKNRAMDLLTYLRSHCVPSSPPQTLTTETDSIELGRGLDIKVVQAVLDRWS